MKEKKLPVDAEQDARKLLEELRVTIYSIGDGVITTDAAGHITRMNPAAESLMGWSESEVLGKPLNEVFRIINERTRVNVENPVERVLREVQVTGLANHTLLIARDGTERPIADSGAPIRDERGEITGVVLVFRDQTTERAAQRALQESEELHRITVENILDPVFITDSEGMFTYICPNIPHILGYSVAEIQAMGNISACVGEGQSLFVLEDLNRKGEISNIEAVIANKNGSKRDYLVTVKRVSIKGGTILYVCRDITKRKQIDNIMRARLRLLELANTHAMDELLTAALDEMEALTGSSIGFYHFLEADQKTLLLQNWSTNTLKNMCTAAGIGSHYPITQAGVWVDCVHERRPVIHNDYASLPHRKGMPEGHAPVIRELVVPIYRDSLIRAIIGVGNKPTNYDESDVEIVLQLGDLSWDIVERKLAEEALRESERRYREIFENTSETINIYSVTEDYRFQLIDSNPATESLTGIPRSLLIGKFIDEYPPTEDMSVLQEHYRECLEKGTTISYEQEFCLDGRCWTVYDTYIPVRDATGRIYRFVTIGMDITKRKLAEEALRESEEKYRLLITNADEAIFIVQDEVVKFPNPKALEMSGYSMEELAGIPFIDLVHPGDKDTVFKTYLRVMEIEQPSEAYPFRIVNKKSKEIWVQLTTAPIIWEKKHGILCFLRDVTSEKKLEVQFLQAQKMEAVGRLAGGVAHDFNNMLVVIIGYTELALEKVDPSQSLFVDLQEIRKSAKRSADLTRQLLAFARKQTIAPKVLDLNETVEGMLTILQRLIGEDINLAWLPGTGVWPVKVDPSQIDQILANLCVNARDAIAGVGKVTIETQPVAFDEAFCAHHLGFAIGEYVLLAVSDNGCGMDKETLDKLFEPFFTTKEQGKGTGLGLATVYGIVKQNNGFISVYSEPGKGSTFKVYIPRFEGQAPPRQMQARSEPTKGAGETVLLVEDEQMVLQLSHRVLERLGYKVLLASTPVKAIQMAEEYAGKIDLLITDVIMPEMNGRDLAERLLFTNPKLKQLFMSGYTGNVIVHHGLLDEGVHFIQKPFSIQNLAAKVREVLDRKST